MLGPGTTDTGLTFTTTMRMVVGVHDGTTYGGTDAHVTLTSGFTDLNQAMINVTYNTNSCTGKPGEPFSSHRREDEE